MSDDNRNVEFQKETFDFFLSQTNKIKPKTVRRMDIVHLIRSNNIVELNELLRDISQENFDENDYFDFTRDELKLLKSYQILTQYMLYSVNTLERNNQTLNELSDKQYNYNKEAEEVIKKQIKKIRSQEQTLGQLTDNCMNLEFLIKKLNLEDKVLELGVQPNNKLLDEEECDRLRNHMENPIPKNLEGQNKLDPNNINQSQNINMMGYMSNNNNNNNMNYPDDNNNMRNSNMMGTNMGNSGTMNEQNINNMIDENNNTRNTNMMGSNMGNSGTMNEQNINNIIDENNNTRNTNMMGSNMGNTGTNNFDN